MSAPAPVRGPGRGSPASSAAVHIPERHKDAVVEFHMGHATAPIQPGQQLAARAAVDELLCRRCGQSRVPPAMCLCAGAAP